MSTNIYDDGDIAAVEKAHNDPNSYSEFIKKNAICSKCQKNVIFSFELRSDRDNREKGGLFKICEECKSEYKF